MTEEASRSHPRAAELLELIREKGFARTCDFNHVKNARAALKALLLAGQIEKVRHGLYKLAGPDARAESGMPAFLGPRQREIWETLAQPHTASELRRMTGVSRQAVNKVLKKLVSDGLVERVVTPDDTDGWLYARIMPIS